MASLGNASDRETVDKELLELIGEVMPEIGENIDFSKDIVAEYGVNSVSIIRLIVAAEGRFGITFTDYELALEGYGTFDDVAALVAKKLEDKE